MKEGKEEEYLACHFCQRTKEGKEGEQKESILVIPFLLQRQRDNTKNKSCVFEEGGRGHSGQRGQSFKNAVSRGKRHDYEIWKCKFDCQETLLSLHRLLLPTVDGAKTRVLKTDTRVFKRAFEKARASGAF